MKRIRMAFAAAVALALLAFPSAAFAEHLTGSNDWTVTFTSAEKMVDNYSESQWADDVRNLEPGDDITFTVNLKHEHQTACDWYMANDVIKSLEEGIAEGSAYTYLLTYTNPSGTTRTLYDSTTVGGDDTNGLNDATSALEDFFYLDNLSKDQNAHVTLLVGLDGETEGNAYFDTLAQLKMKFAVELPTNRSTTPPSNTPTRPNDPGRTTVQTGDDTNLFPFYVAMAASGALLLCIGVFSVRRRKKGAHE